MNISKQIKKQTVLLGLLTSALCSSVHALEIEPTTVYFSVKNFGVRNYDGNWDRYSVAGFYAPGANPRVYLLPRIKLTAANLTYIDKRGRKISADKIETISADDISVVKIAPSYDATMPNLAQGVGISDTIKGQSRPLYAPAPMLALGGLPAIANTAGWWNQYIGTDVALLINTDTDSYNKSARQGLAASEKFWTDIKPRAVDLKQLTVSLSVDGLLLAQRQIQGTAILASGELPELNIMVVTETLLNRLREGTFEIDVGFSFTDSKVASIDARFDYARVINKYLEQTRTAITQSKNTSFGIFNIGYRKASLSQSINEQVTEQTSDKKTEKTVIVMDDATDSMISLFESRFFPSLPFRSVIENHLKAAQEAKDNGQPDLAKAHLNYVDALQKSNPKGEIDALAAAAALSSGNYAMFVAQGVKFFVGNDTANYSFHSVISNNVTEGANKKWSDVRHISTNRLTTMIIKMEPENDSTVSFGMCGTRIVGYPSWVPYNGWVSRKVVMITCVTEGSPLALLNVFPGQAIEYINSTRVNSVATLTAALNQLRPGDIADVILVEPIAPGTPPQLTKVSVTVKRGFKL